MRKAIGLLFLMPFVMSCKPQRNVAADADDSSDVSVRITSTDPLSCPIITIHNDTGGELRVWYNGNSWGWWNLSFCAAMEDGSIIHIERGANIAFTSNAPMYETIAPGKEAVRDRIDFSEKYWRYWDIPKNFNLDKVRYISAIYFVKPTKESAEKGVWTGIVVSPWVPVSRQLTRSLGDCDVWR
jgi:hypothetical protein